MAEKTTKIGLIIAVCAGIFAPMSLLTSYYGMNVIEFTPEASNPLISFWELGIPTLILTVVGFMMAALWIWGKGVNH